MAKVNVYKCPNCRTATGSFSLTVEALVVLNARGGLDAPVEEGDLSWEHGTVMCCDTCDFEDTVGAFEGAAMGED